jgi:hypothetical protein
MHRISKDDLDALVERALKDSVTNVAPPDKVWASIRLGVQRRGQQPPAALGYLRHLAAEVMALGDDIGSTARIMLASLYVRSNGEEWSTERLVVARRSAAPLHYSIHH